MPAQSRKVKGRAVLRASARVVNTGTARTTRTGSGAPRAAARLVAGTGIVTVTRRGTGTLAVAATASAVGQYGSPLRFARVEMWAERALVATGTSGPSGRSGAAVLASAALASAAGAFTRAPTDTGEGTMPVGAAMHAAGTVRSYSSGSAVLAASAHAGGSAGGHAASQSSGGGVLRATGHLGATAPNAVAVDTRRHTAAVVVSRGTDA